MQREALQYKAGQGERGNAKKRDYFISSQVCSSINFMDCFRTGQII